MKTLQLTAVHCLFVFLGFSQIESEIDSVVALKANPQEVVFRCATSVSNSQQPLYVLDGVPLEWDSAVLKELDPDKVVAISVLKDIEAISCYGSAAQNGVVLITTDPNIDVDFPEKELPFKVHKICNTNWVQIQDVYNALRATVPSLSITNSGLNRTPKISMRGDDNTIVILDGVRYDASILNAINPADIEHVKVATGAAATNYLRNNFNN